MGKWLKNRWETIAEVMEWDFWEWLILSRDGRAAAMMAGTIVATLFRSYLSPAVGHGLIGAFIASAIILLPSLLMKMERTQSQVLESPLEMHDGIVRWREGRLRQVSAQEFRHQEVRLDGMHYIDCVFDGVTFVYSGTAKTEISNGIIRADPQGRPNMQFRADNLIVATTVLILQELGLMRPDARRRIESPPVDRQ